MKYSGKKILIGITGGISAYKTAELIRQFVKDGAEVKTIMTRSAREFITPLTIETLSQNSVTTGIFPHEDHPEISGTHHISLAQWPDVFLIVPASGSIIGKIANGIADEALSTIVMASPAPKIFAPAMNDKMYRNSIVQQNISILKEQGWVCVDPEYGFLAEGYEGIGRLAELDKIVWAADKILFGNDSLKNKKILVTAGPTHEPLDPVRFLTNASSGKMGYALARQAILAGADITLISGPTHLMPPPEAKVVSVKTSEEMANAVEKHFPKSDILLMTAAVADFKPSKKAEKKIKKDKNKDSVTIEFDHTPDILKRVAKEKKNQVVIGFALETTNGLEHARLKLRDKDLDFILLNNPNEEGAGFDIDTNIVTYIDAHETEKWPLMSKDEVASKILEKIGQLKHKRKK